MKANKSYLKKEEREQSGAGGIQFEYCLLFVSLL
jgi:hypothetical protein